MAAPPPLTPLPACGEKPDQPEVAEIRETSQAAKPFFDDCLAHMNRGLDVLVASEGPPIEYVRMVRRIAGNPVDAPLCLMGFWVIIDERLAAGTWRFIGPCHEPAAADATLH